MAPRSDAAGASNSDDKGWAEKMSVFQVEYIMYFTTSEVASIRLKKTKICGTS